jgi:hypothetical protein
VVWKGFVGMRVVRGMRMRRMRRRRRGFYDVTKKICFVGLWRFGSGVVS